MVVANQSGEFQFNMAEVFQLEELLFNKAEVNQSGGVRAFKAEEPQEDRWLEEVLW